MQKHDFSRSLQLQGATNFRDLGGYAGAGGRTVRWRRLFRSDHLGSLTAQDQAALRQLGLARVYDFRGTDERATAACVMDGVAVHSLPIEPTIVQRLSELLAAGKPPGAAGTVALMQDTYRGFVQNSTHHFAALFAHLLASDAPMVFHCTAGKDRTGFAAALILEGLGVPREVVLEDYLLTNSLLVMRGHGGALPPEIASVLYRVQLPFLEAAFEAVEQGHGSVANYLETALGVGPRERERLQALYLE